MSKKLVSLDHLRMEAERSAGLASQVAAAAAEAIEELDSKKQNKLTGVAGEIVGFDASGNPVAQTAPAAGVSSFKGRTGAVTPQSGDYTAAQVGARPDTWTPTAAQVGAVPASRKVNGKALSGDIGLTASDVGAATIEQVNAAIDEAITGVINASY